MAYSQGGLIQASDYNGFLNGANQVNKIWSTGSGDAGYGQTVLPTVSSGGTVSAAQWSTLINTMNIMSMHQSNTGTGISPVTSGSTIFWISLMSSAINTLYTNRKNAYSAGTTTTGSTFSPNFTVANTMLAQTWTFTRTMTFASGDAARYFFNAGGYFNFVTTSVVNGSTSGSIRSSGWTTLIGTNLQNLSGIAGHSNGGRTGIGGTVVTNSTNLGYWDSTTTTLPISKILSASSTYSGDYVQVAIRSNGTQGIHNDAGSVLYLDFTVYSGAVSSSFNEDINVTWNHRIDTVYPETTSGLTSTWGTVTIT